MPYYDVLQYLHITTYINHFATAHTLLSGWEIQRIKHVTMHVISIFLVILKLMFQIF